MGALLPSTSGGPPGVAAEATDVLTPVQCDEVTDFEDCHSRFPAGCGAHKYDAYTNILKNQLTPPPPQTQDIALFTKLSDFDTLNDATPAGLSKHNHHDFKSDLDNAGEGQLREIIGYLYYVKEEGPESSNCGLDDKDRTGANVDYHIGIGFDSDVAQRIPDMRKMSATERSAFQHSFKTKSIVVEMTPHYRNFFEKEVWTFDNVKRALGKKVRVAGQLMIDNEHDIASQNCFRAKKASQRASCWRYSAWELHPVVRFQVCVSGTCTQNAGEWAELDNQPAGSPTAGSPSSPGGAPAHQPATGRGRTTHSATPRSGPGGQP
jgi:hypothetical protein